MQIHVIQNLKPFCDAYYMIISKAITINEYIIFGHIPNKAIINSMP